MVDHAHIGPRFYFDENMTAAALVTCAGGVAAVLSARSPMKDSPNEDSIAVIPLTGDHAVLAIADGVGGQPSGEMASRVALETLATAVTTASSVSTGDIGALRAAIVDGIEQANKAVMRTGNGSTTLAVAEIQSRRVRSFHVGDSTILLTGQRGRLKMQTIAHSPVGYALESGMLNDEEAIVHEDRHLVSNVLGAPDMRIEIGPIITLSPRDTLLIASDGLSDNIHLTEIVQIIRKGRLDRAAEALRSGSLERMAAPDGEYPSKPDDLSFIAFRLVGAATGARRRQAPS